MSTFLFFLGREPYISLAELHSLFDNVRAYSGYALIDANHDHVLSIAHRLGGTIKIGKVCFMDVTKTALVDRCAELMSESCMEGKKLRIAVDTYPGNLGNIALKVKDVLKKNGHSVRVVQHESTGRVKNATTIHEKMISQGYEAIVIQHEGMYLIAQTVWVQDIE